jgi:ABC-2 type transport system permease protein
VIRAFLTGIRVHLVQLVRSPFDLVAMLIWPIIYASIAYYLIGTGSNTRVLFTASLGAAMMMLWSQVIVGSGFALDMQRNQGTLELLVAAPVPLVAVIAPIMIASAAFGIYGLLVTLAWGRFAFGIPVAIDHPVAFAVAAAAAVLAVGLLGLIAAALFVLTRAAAYVGVALQYPVYLASGLIIPLAILPAWLGPVSWVLAPTWGYRGLTHAASGTGAWREIGMCLLLSVVYLVVALPCLAWFERLARERATLRLS